MRLNESIIKNLTESDENVIRYKNTEEDSYITVGYGKITDTTDGEITDFGEFVGTVKVAETNYIGFVRDNVLYVYSFDSGFPFKFLPEGEE